MIQGRCPECRLIWHEDRGPGDSPIHNSAFLCPRCGVHGDIDKTLWNPEQPYLNMQLFDVNNLVQLKRNEDDDAAA